MKSLTALLILIFSAEFGYGLFGQDAAVLSPLIVQSNAIQTMHMHLQKLNDLNELKILAYQLQSFKENLETARKIKGEIEKVHGLYENFNKARKRISNIKGISLADGLYFTEMFTGVELNPLDYIPGVGGKTESFKNDVRGIVGRPWAARNLYRGMTGMTKVGETFLENYVLLDPHVAMDLEDAAMQAHMEQYAMLTDLIYKKYFDASELRNMANDPNMEMEESERIAMNERANKLIQEVVELRTQSVSMLVDIQNMEHGKKVRNWMAYSINLKAKQRMSSVIFRTVNGDYQNLEGEP